MARRISRNAITAQWKRAPTFGSTISVFTVLARVVSALITREQQACSSTCYECSSQWRCEPSVGVHQVRLALPALVTSTPCPMAEICEPKLV